MKISKAKAIVRFRMLHTLLTAGFAVSAVFMMLYAMAGLYGLMEFYGFFAIISLAGAYFNLNYMRWASK